MRKLQKRVERIEERYGMGKADEPTVEIPMGKSVLRMTAKQLTGLLNWLQERNRVFGDASHELTDATC